MATDFMVFVELFDFLCFDFGDVDALPLRSGFTLEAQDTIAQIKSALDAIAVKEFDQPFIL